MPCFQAILPDRGLEQIIPRSRLTPEKIHERLALGNPFIRSILEKGKVLYEANYG